MAKNMLILLCDSPYQNDSADYAYEIALSALNKGHKVNIFLMMDGVYNPITAQNGELFNLTSTSEKMAELMEKGATVTLCRVCKSLRGVEDNLIPENMDTGGIFDFSEMMSESDVVLNFIRGD